MASKRQRKKNYKKLGLWGFDAIVTCNKGIKHGFEIGTPVKFLDKDRVSKYSIYCVGNYKPLNCDIVQVVEHHNLKKIR